MDILKIVNDFVSKIKYWYFKEPECAGNGIVGIAKNGVPIYNSVGADCCDLALKVS